MQQVWAAHLASSQACCRRKERGQDGQRLSPARTQIHNTATHKTTSSNLLPKENQKHNTPTGNNQECQSGAEGQVAQKEPTGPPRPGGNPHRPAANGQKPPGAQALPKRLLPPPFPPQFFSCSNSCGSHIREAGGRGLLPSRAGRAAPGFPVTHRPWAHRARGCRRRAPARGLGWRNRGCPASLGG